VLPGVRSTYRWEGAVERSEEVLLMVKTSDESLAVLMERIAALHPYDVPEIVALDADAVHPPYERWVDDSTTRSAGA
jgi:periplasmic divalent cation tolerance protein